jgi:hypothetical protein
MLWTLFVAERDAAWLAREEMLVGLLEEVVDDIDADLDDVWRHRVRLALTRTPEGKEGP